MLKLSPQQKQSIREKAQARKLNFVAIFGSTARGATHAKSDLDVAIQSQGAMSYKDEARLREELCSIFKRGDVEIVNVRRASPLLKIEVAREGKLLYESARGNFAKFNMYAFKTYVEAKPLYRLKERQLQNFLNN